jgi:LCP family protein required for cell wall assembly
MRALCASLSLLVIVASGVAWATFKNFTASVPHGSAVPALLSGEKDPDGGDQNILLIGNDTRAGATRAEQKALHIGHDDQTVNADTMMVLHIPANGSKPTIVSFPRDSWVTIPGYGRGKINASYPDGYNEAMSHHLGEKAAESAGIIQTIRSIHALTGLYIDHYMQVSLLGFYRISNAIGGVTVCLKHAQNKTTEVGDGGHGNSGINLPKGVSVIKGAQALAFVRQRHGLPHGDLDRIKRQQYFLKSAFTKIVSAGTLLNPFKLHDLLVAVGSSLLTDPSLDLLTLARQLESLTSGKINFATLPNNGPQLIYPDGVETSIVQVNRAAIPAFVQGLEGKSSSALKEAKAARPSTVTVDVLNGTDIPRLAARNGNALVRAGFHTNTIDSTSSTKQTTVEYPAGKEADAKAVLALVPKAKAVATPAVDRVTLVIGNDGVLVTGVHGVAPAARGAASSTASTHPSSTAEKRVSAPANGLGCID